MASTVFRHGWEENTEYEDMYILIVDDEKSIRMLLKDILESGNLTKITTFASAEEAMQYLGLKSSKEIIHPVDLILMDISMPGINGIEASRMIKADGRYQDVPIIIQTIEADPKILKEAFEAGANDFVRKPFNEIELLARVRSTLKLKREMDIRKDKESSLIHLTEKLREANHNLERLSLKDKVTGVANRRFLELVLDREWRRTVRNSLPLSLIMIDIDYFKLYNDTKGHQAGDECLNRVGQKLFNSLKRPGDLLGRYGGEEFLVVLPDTNQADAVAIAESLRMGVRDLKISHSASKVRDIITVSLGVAGTSPTQEMDPDSLLSLADQALYRAKTQGRDRVSTNDVQVS